MYASRRSWNEPVPLTLCLWDPLCSIRCISYQTDVPPPLSIVYRCPVLGEVGVVIKTWCYVIADDPIIRANDNIDVFRDRAEFAVACGGCR